MRIRTETTGEKTTFGGVIRLVEQAEGNRARVQLVADRFAAYYLPVVAGIAGLTYFLRGDPHATAAVLVVACSCAFTLATPIAMLASVGAAARRGVMVKGGKYLEALEKVDTRLLDKTGTLTLGKPKITDFICVDGRYASGVNYGEDDVVKRDAEAEMLRLAALVRLRAQQACCEDMD